MRCPSESVGFRWIPLESVEVVGGGGARSDEVTSGTPGEVGRGSEGSHASMNAPARLRTTGWRRPHNVWRRGEGRGGERWVGLG